MPESGVTLVPMAGMLSYEEIATVARAAMAAGVRRFRLTGGEPLARRGIAALVRLLAGLGPDDLALTTNGLHLADVAADLKAAGLARVTVSLDTLRADRFEMITRRKGLDRIFAGIDAARAAGLAPLKVNTVVIRGVNDDEIPDFVRFAEREGVELRFIELMPTSGLSPECKELGAWRPSLFVKGEAVRARIAGIVRTARTASGRGRRRSRLPARREDAPGLHRPGLGPVLPGLRAPAARARRPAEGLPLRQGRFRSSPGPPRGSRRTGRDRGPAPGRVRGQEDLGARRDRGPDERHVQDRRVTMKVGILTVSDKGSRGEREDRSGPAVREMIEAAGGEVVRTKIVPDEPDEIRAVLIAWSDEGLDLVLTTGGTGFSPRDRTPEATKSVIERDDPGPRRSHAPGGGRADPDGHPQPGGRRHPEGHPHRQPAGKREGGPGEPGRRHARPAPRHRHPQGRGLGVRQAASRLNGDAFVGCVTIAD